MGKRTIIFYAPVGTNLPVHLLGGGEKGCRRTREILSNAGYNVITIDSGILNAIEEITTERLKEMKAATQEFIYDNDYIIRQIMELIEAKS